MHNFPERILTLRRNLGHTQGEMADRLGVKGNYISLLERGQKEPSDSLVRLVELMELAVSTGLYGRKEEQVVPEASPREEIEPVAEVAPTRMIPVVSWVHAGHAENYEELPKDWQRLVPTECRDESAFALRLEGDSMTRDYHPGDLLIVSPGAEVYSGCLAVIRFVNDSVVFREIELRSDVVRLMPLNERWSPETIPLDQVSWIFRVYGMWRQLVK